MARASLSLMRSVRNLPYHEGAGEAGNTKRGIVEKHSEELDGSQPS